MMIERLRLCVGSLHQLLDRRAYRPRHVGHGPFARRLARRNPSSARLRAVSWRLRRRLAVAAVVAAMLAPTGAAQAFVNGWSFIDRNTRRAVHDTVVGLGDGYTDAAGLTATVDVAPDATLLGTFAGNSGGFVTTDGVVTYAEAFFQSSDRSAGVFFSVPLARNRRRRILPIMPKPTMICPQAARSGTHATLARRSTAHRHAGVAA